MSTRSCRYGAVPVYAGQSSEPPVTVAIVSWNTRTLLAQCLESLHEDARALRAEVWVVDNDSSDGSAALVRYHFPWVKLIASSNNMGFGAAVNAVAARTGTRWLAPANADVRLTPMHSRGS